MTRGAFLVAYDTTAGEYPGVASHRVVKRSTTPKGEFSLGLAQHVVTNTVDLHSRYVMHTLEFRLIRPESITSVLTLSNNFRPETFLEFPATKF